MALTLAQLVAAKTAAQLRAQLLAGLAGIGIVTRTASGTGGLSVGGTPTASYSVQIQIVKEGKFRRKAVIDDPEIITPPKKQ